jgi:laccase
LTKIATNDTFFP